MNIDVIGIIENELKRPKEFINYEYIRGLINMAYFLNYINGDTRASLLIKASQFIN